MEGTNEAFEIIKNYWVYLAGIVVESAFPFSSELRKGIFHFDDTSRHFSTP